VLTGLVRGDDVDDLMAVAVPRHVLGWFLPDVALLESAVAALDLACPSGAEPGRSAWWRFPGWSG
jgi:hypothetical protein